MIALWFLTPVFGIDRTPETVTAPRLSYACEIVDAAFQRSPLRFETVGGRGYARPDGTVDRTPIAYRFSQDGTGVLADAAQVSPLDGERGMRFSTDTMAAELREVTPFMKSEMPDGWRASIVVTIDRGQSLDRHVGFCDVREERQAPLSASETKEFLSK